MYVSPKKALILTLKAGFTPDFISGTPNLVRGLKVGVVHHE